MTTHNFNPAKETPGAVRYQEVVAETEEPGIGTLYFRKWWLKEKFGIDVVLIGG